jgi:hypothetical protein
MRSVDPVPKPLSWTVIVAEPFAAGRFVFAPLHPRIFCPAWAVIRRRGSLIRALSLTANPVEQEYLRRRIQGVVYK